MTAELKRLSRQKDFEKVFRQGKLVQNNLFILRWLGGNLADNRVAIVVSNKVAKRAVVRNKLRRRVRVILQQILAGRQGGDLIFIAKAEVADKDFLAMKQSLLDLSVRALDKKTN